MTKSAIVASVLIHLSILGAGVNAPRDMTEKKTILVEYVKIKEAAESKAVETPKLELKDNVNIRPPEKPAVQAADKKAEFQDIQDTLARKQAAIKSTEDYISYYQVIREKIRRRLKTNYFDYSKEGEVGLVFTLDRDGRLIAYDTEKDTGAIDNALVEIALKSLREAAPFPAFPKALSLPKMTFNVVVSFKRK